MLYAVDLPNPCDLSGPWINIANFSDKETARKFVKDHIGNIEPIDIFITEVETELNDYPEEHGD